MKASIWVHERCTWVYVFHTLHGNACFVIAIIGTEHRQVVIKYVDCHWQLQCSQEVLDHCGIAGHFVLAP